MKQSTNITKIVETNYNNIRNLTDEIIEQYNLSENHPDVIIINSEKKDSIGIEKVRDLKILAYTKPFNTEHKLVIIQNGDLLTIQAQNAILKITEEPPEFTHIYLIVENHKNLLQTIVSRSEIIINKKNDKINVKLTEIENFCKLSQVDKFKFVDTLAKNSKLQVQRFLDNFIVYARENQYNCSIISKLIKYKEALSKNVTKKLILDNLVILLE